MAFQALRRGASTATEPAEALGVTKQAAGEILHDLEDQLAAATSTLRAELARLIRAQAGDTLPPLRPVW
jgi:hypothetical protein